MNCLEPWKSFELAQGQANGEFEDGRSNLVIPWQHEFLQDVSLHALCRKYLVPKNCSL